MGRFFGLIGPIVFVVMGLLQLAALYAFLYDYWGWNSFLAILVGFILAYFPIIGSICGIIGAMYAWHWAWWQAGLLFLWWIPLLIIVLIVNLLEKRRDM